MDIDSQFEMLYSKLGFQLTILGKYPEAVQVFSDALLVNSENPEYYIGLIIVHFMNG